jgi:hypothetical protein
MRRALLLLLSALVLHARECSAASRQLNFIEYAPVRIARVFFV